MTDDWKVPVALLALVALGLLALLIGPQHDMLRAIVSRIQ